MSDSYLYIESLNPCHQVKGVDAQYIETKEEADIEC